MNLDLTNKTALVCGGSQGLGLATAHELALLGANVVLASRSREKLVEAVQHLPVPMQQQHQYLQLDLSNTALVTEQVSAWIAKGQTIDILVNNAGGPPSGPLLPTTTDALLQAFNTHLLTSHALVQLVLPGMRAAGYGRVVNIVSTSIKEPIKGLGISNSVRAAVANWCKTLAGEEGYGGITFNNVLPGFTDTDRLAYLFQKQAADRGVDEQQVRAQAETAIPARRLGKPEEFGAAVAFLCSPAAAYINGINLPVDGGRTNCL